MLSAHAFLSSHNGTYIAKTTGATTSQFNFFRLWKQRLVCEPCKARDSTKPGDKTRTRSLFTAVISFNLAAFRTLDRRDLQCYHFISVWSKTDYFSGQEHMLSLVKTCLLDPKESSFQTGLVNTKPCKKNYKNQNEPEFSVIIPTHVKGKKK